jgi:hypothetical protein
MKTDEKIFDADDLARRDGTKTHREWINKVCRDRARKNLLDTPFSGRISGDAVPAFVDFGRWLAHCPDCNGAEYVSYEEKVFYCFSCGNYSQKGDGRPVNFPRNKTAIEAELLKRAQLFTAGGNPLARQFHARAKLPQLSRTWNIDETVEDLQEQRISIENKIKGG